MLCSKNNPTIEDISLTGVPDLTNGNSKDKMGRIRFWGTAAFSTKTAEPGHWGA